MVARLAAALSLLVVAPAPGFAPAHVIHEMRGRMVGRREVAIGLRVDCVFYEEGPTCTGTWRCKPLRSDRRPGEPACRHPKGRATLEVRYGPSSGLDPSLGGRMAIRFAGGGSCQLEGTVPYLFGAEVPGMFGHYRCVDASDVETEQGVFGFRTRRVGKPFRDFD